jgi:hypothetical protein
MAQTVKVNGVTYSNVPSVQIPLDSGGGNAVFHDTSNATATAGDIVSGVVAYNSNGAVTGTLTLVSVSQNSTTKILTVS